MLNIACSKNEMLFVFPTASKISTVHIIHSILTQFNNEQHLRKFMRFDKDGALENSTDVTKLLVDDFRIYM